MSDINPLGVIRILAKIDVDSAETVSNWYQDNLGLVINQNFTDVPSWRQVSKDGHGSGGVIGFYAPDKQPSCGNGAVTTLVVENIQTAVECLRSKDIQVQDPYPVGEGILEAGFSDKWENPLMLRQNDAY